MTAWRGKIYWGSNQKTHQVVDEFPHPCLADRPDSAIDHQCLVDHQIQIQTRSFLTSMTGAGFSIKSDYRERLLYIEILYLIDAID